KTLFTRQKTEYCSVGSAASVRHAELSGVAHSESRTSYAHSVCRHGRAESCAFSKRSELYARDVERPHGAHAYHGTADLPATAVTLKRKTNNEHIVHLRLTARPLS